ncbi:MAG: hypothetical protein AAFV95_03570 [Bacteroidota bacterium]
MKARILFFALLIFCAAACEKDNDNGLKVDDGLLHYDGDNDSGPNLAPGTYEAAIRLSGKDLEAFQDQELKEITIFMAFPPAGCALKVYGAGTDSSPGPLLYSVDVTDVVRELTWFTHRLPDGVNIDGNDLWISMAVEHRDTRQSISCDAGPNRADGDWFYSSEDQQWRTYVNRTSESINWNIRARVQ